MFGVDGFLQNLYEIREQDRNILTKVMYILHVNN